MRINSTRICSAIVEADYSDINAMANQIAKEDQTYERLVLTKEEALRLFGDNPFKVLHCHILSGLFWGVQVSCDI